MGPTDSATHDGRTGVPSGKLGWVVGIVMLGGTVGCTDTGPLVAPLTPSTADATVTTARTATATATATTLSPAPVDSVVTVTRLSVGGMPITVSGIEAPEPGVQCWGNEALTQAQDLLQGKQVRLVLDPTGEVSHVLLLGGGDYADMLVRSGAVTVVGTQSGLLTAESTARASKFGLWGDPCKGSKVIATRPIADQPVVRPVVPSVVQSWRTGKITEPAAPVAPTRGTVTPGAFCSTDGAVGMSKGGVALSCSHKPGDSRLRWRAV